MYVLQTAGRVAAARNGRNLELLLAGSDSDDTVAVLDCDIPANTFGPPLHRHPASDETFIVLTGALLVHDGQEVTRVEPGGLVHVARGDTHTFATPPDTGVRFIAIHTPAGFEQFHLASRDAAQQAGRPLSPGELITLAGKYDWELAGPPLLPSGALGAPTA